MKYIYGAVAACLVSLCASAAFAEPNTSEAEAAEKKEEQNRRDFAGLNMGVGLSLTLDVGEHDRVTEAEVVDGIVRVSNEDNARARIMLESHFFFQPSRPFLHTSVQEFDWGVGPFVAIQPGEKDLVDAIALGVMVGFRRPNTSNSWNIGLGYVVDPNTKTLGDGLAANKPLPPGETQIRYKEQDQGGVVILTSFSF